jgi:hypothetical protein
VLPGVMPDAGWRDVVHLALVLEASGGQDDEHAPGCGGHPDSGSHVLDPPLFPEMVGKW